MPRGPKQIVEIRSLARAQTEQAIKVLTGVMNQKGAPPAARVTAASLLLDRGWGKAPQQLTGEDGGDIKIIIRQIIETATQSDEPALIEHDDATGQSDV